MSKGTVKWFNSGKRFGFIQQDEGGDLFVHASSLTGGMTELTEGQRVGFEVEQSDKGPRAINVVALDEPPRQMPPRPSGGGPGGARSSGGGRRDFKPKRFSKRMFS